MNERGKSDPAVVATKLANKAERSAAEPVEPRAGTKGNANQQHTGRTQSRETVSQVLARIRQTARTAICRHSPEVGAVCGKAARTDLCGGRGAISVPTATDLGGAASRQLSAVRRTAGSCCGGLALTLRVAELTWFFCQTNSDEGRDDISFCYLNRSSE